MYNEVLQVSRLAYDQLQEVCRYDGTLRIATAFDEIFDVPASRSVYTDILYILVSVAHLGSTNSEAVPVRRIVTAPFLLGSTGVGEPRLMVH